MPGRPKRREDLAILSNILPPQAQSIYESIAAGNSLGRIAEANAVGRWALTTWLEDPTRIELYNRARKRAATTLAEATIEIADGPEDSGTGGGEAEGGTPAEFGAPDVQRDKLRIQSRQWLASRWDRETYGEVKGAAVQVNIGSLHIDALRRMSVEPLTINAVPKPCQPE